MRAAGRSGGVDVQGMQTGCELGLERLVHGPVPRQPREAGESCRAHLDRIVRFAAGGSARVSVVQMRLIHYIKLGWVKRCNKCRSHALYARCQFLRH